MKKKTKITIGSTTGDNEVKYVYVEPEYYLCKFGICRARKHWHKKGEVDDFGNSL